MRLSVYCSVGVGRHREPLLYTQLLQSSYSVTRGLNINYNNKRKEPKPKQYSCDKKTISNVNDRLLICPMYSIPHVLYTRLDLQQKEEVAVHIYLGKVWILNRRKGLLLIFFLRRSLDPEQEEGVAVHVYLGEVWILNRRKGLLTVLSRNPSVQFIQHSPGD